MTARVLDGKAIAAEIQQELTEGASEVTRQLGRQACLAAVLVGADPASEVYVRNKRRACERIGIASQLHRLPPETSQADLLQLVQQLNADPQVDGILVQLPLPGQIREQAVLDAVLPAKDVDAFHPENVGLLMQGRPRFLPCTPHGVLQILHRSQIPVAGRHVVVIGRSEIVGKPMAALLVQRHSLLGDQSANATVTVCHSRTPDLPSFTRLADILIAAIGRARFVTAEMVRPQAVVIDVGINRTDSGLVGDVDYDAVCAVASAITPVPGGVGPLTVTMLLHNTLQAARGLHNHE